jgi:hypothetical protein
MPIGSAVVGEVKMLYVAGEFLGFVPKLILPALYPGLDVPTMVESRLIDPCCDFIASDDAGVLVWLLIGDVPSVEA